MTHHQTETFVTDPDEKAVQAHFRITDMGILSLQPIVVGSHLKVPSWIRVKSKFLFV